MKGACPGSVLTFRSRLLIYTIGTIVNDRNFPSFANLPDENDLDMDYYSEVNPGRYSPYRHWCFVGEIEEVTTLMRVRVTVSLGSACPLGLLGGGQYWYSGSQ